MTAKKSWPQAGCLEASVFWDEAGTTTEDILVAGLIYICFLGQCRKGFLLSTMPHASLTWQGCPVAQLQYVILLGNQEHLSEKYDSDPGIGDFWYSFKVQQKIKYRLGGKNQRERSQERGWVSRYHLKMEVTRGSIQDPYSWNNSPALI